MSNDIAPGSAYHPMKPTRIGKPHTVTDHGKPVTRAVAYFPDGTSELMSLPRLKWTIAHGRPEKGFVVYERDGKLVCEPRASMASHKNKGSKGPKKSAGSRKGWQNRRWNARARAAKVYIDHKPYPLAA